VIAFVLAITTLYFGRRIFIPFALALVFSFLLSPFVGLFEKIRFRRVPAVIAVLVVSLALMGLATWSLAGQMVAIMNQLPDFKDNLDEKIASLRGANTGGLSKATATIQELNKELSAQPKAAGQGRPSRPVQVQVTPPSSGFIQDLGALLGPLSGPAETTVIAIIFTVFMLVKREDLRNRALRLAGRGQLSVMTQALDDAGRRLSRYLVMQFLVNAGYGLAYGVALYLIGIPQALLWGLIAGLLRFVPYIGTFLGASMPVVLAIAVFPGWRQAGLAFGTFLVLELTVSNFVEPMLYGAHTGISSLAILVAAVFWATLWGPVGLILSTPLTVCLVVLGRYVPQLNFLEVLLGDEPVLPPEQLFYQRLVAGDEEEARTIALAYLKEHPVESFYESILVPALRLAEHDFHNNALDDETRRSILRSSADVIDDMDDQLALADSTHAGEHAYRNRNQCGVEGLTARVACLPARSGADELVITMLLQLLQYQGQYACRLKAQDLDEVLAQVSRQKPSVLCISCISPFATSSARSLCRHLKAAHPDLRIIVGFWGFDGGDAAASERLGQNCPSFVTASLSECLNQIRRLSVEPDAFEVAEKSKRLTAPSERLAGKP